MCKCDK